MPPEAPLAAKIREIAERLKTRRPGAEETASPAVTPPAMGEAAPLPAEAPLAAKIRALAESLKTPRLDPVTVRQALGPRPDPHLLACLRWDVLLAVRSLEQEIATGVIAPAVSLVHGKPLADWLSLDDLARLLEAGRDRSAR